MTDTVWTEKHDIRKLADECFPVVSGTPSLDDGDITHEQLATLFNRWKRNDNGMTWLEFARSAFLTGDNTLFVSWCGMVVGIEPDGYGHT